MCHVEEDGHAHGSAAGSLTSLAPSDEHWTATLSSRACMQDDDPYVRKTAAICVAKLYDINPEMVDDRGFLDVLRVSST